MDKTGFKNAGRAYLFTVTTSPLRNYARMVGVAAPTEKLKDDLIDEILAIKCGELSPAPPSNRGKPVLHGRVDPTIIEEMEKLCLLYLGDKEEKNAEIFPSEMPPINLQAEWEKLQKNPFTLCLEDSTRSSSEKEVQKEMCMGQLQTLNSVPMLLPLNCIANGEKTIISVDLIREYKLREGDVISCFVAKSHNVNVVNHITSVNGVHPRSLERFSFDEGVACEPQEKISLMGREASSTTLKFFEWLAPLFHGQRACIFSEPKAGKTRIIFELAKAIHSWNRDTEVFALLIDESPEAVEQFRKIIPEGNFVYTTYEDEPERQVFVADYILKRAKRYAEGGKKVILLVDSLTALAKAYNETEDSAGAKTLAHGLESKTLHYIKKYFGSARCFEKGGALTIIATSSCATGNPVDDMISSEISSLANFETTLNGELVMKRSFPALDLQKTYRKTTGQIQSLEEQEIEEFVRSEYLFTHNAELLLRVLRGSDTFLEFEKNIRK